MFTVPERLKKELHDFANYLELQVREENFDMGDWYHVPTGLHVQPSEPIQCGTTACLAGHWAVKLGAPTLYAGGFIRFADERPATSTARGYRDIHAADWIGERLGLTLGEWRPMSDVLFLAGHWPLKFQLGSVVSLKTAADRVRHFAERGE